VALLTDLHNHSCLSPCGSLELSPHRLLALAAGRGLRVMALTDHNSSLNCRAFAKLCPRFGIIPVFGMEATTSEEIHALCLFTDLDACLAFGEYAYSILTPFPNDPDKVGDQVYVDEEDNIEGEVEYYLLNPLALSIEEIGAKVAEYSGIVIPAHVDRPAFSMSSQLGVVTDGPWAALECVRIPPVAREPLNKSAESAVPSAFASCGAQMRLSSTDLIPIGLNQCFPSGSPLDTLGYSLITSSDAHYMEHVARRPFELDVSAEELQPNGPGTEADLRALRMALGRRPAG